jgi:hypothetical protein
VELPTAAGFRSEIFTTTLLVRRTLKRRLEMGKTIRFLAKAVAAVLVVLGHGCSKRSEPKHDHDTAPTLSAVAGSDGHAAVADANVADANVAPDADTTVDVFTNISENGMFLTFDHRTTTFRWLPNPSDPTADRTLKNADTTPAVEACVRVLVAAVRRCQACAIESGHGKAAGGSDCWSTRAERCAYANGVPASAVDTCVQQVTAAPCSLYEQTTWQLPTGCDGYALGDAEKWHGPQSPADEQRAKDQRCADLAAKWCKDERFVYGSRLMAADQQICDQGGCQYPGQAVLPDTFDDRGCRNRLTKLCQRGRARFKVKPGRDPKGMFAWCVDIDDMDEWQCH